MPVVKNKYWMQPPPRMEWWKCPVCQQMFLPTGRVIESHKAKHFDELVEKANDK